MMAAEGAALQARDITAGYRRRRVLDGLSLPTLHPGEVTALVGPNAAGKTTLLRVLAGLLPARGELHLGTEDLLKMGHQARAERVTYMPQALPQRVALNVLEGVMSALLATPLPGRPGARAAQARALAVLERVGIAGLALTPLDQLSGGQRQLASLAQALAREPQVLLLDEPTSALDLRHALTVMKLVKELTRQRRMISILVLHDVAAACRWADRIVLLAEGRIAAAGAPEEAVTPESLAATYQVKARVERSGDGLVQILVDDTV